jgi:hypothetical protein
MDNSTIISHHHSSRNNNNSNTINIMNNNMYEQQHMILKKDVSNSNLSSDDVNINEDAQVGLINNPQSERGGERSLNTLLINHSTIPINNQQNNNQQPSWIPLVQQQQQPNITTTLQQQQQQLQQNVNSLKTIGSAAALAQMNNPAFAQLFVAAQALQQQQQQQGVINTSSSLRKNFVVPPQNENRFLNMNTTSPTLKTQSADVMITKRTNTNMATTIDDRELKRQRRKQSNRESARRSRLRKQAETEELGGVLVTLQTDNAKLREAVQKLEEERAVSNRNIVLLKKSSSPETISKLELFKNPYQSVHVVDTQKSSDNNSFQKDQQQGSGASSEKIETN